MSLDDRITDGLRRFVHDVEIDPRTTLADSVRRGKRRTVRRLSIISLVFTLCAAAAIAAPLVLITGKSHRPDLVGPIAPDGSLGLPSLSPNPSPSSTSPGRGLVAPRVSSEPDEEPGGLWTWKNGRDSDIEASARAISGDGRFIAFTTSKAIFVRDGLTGETSSVSGSGDGGLALSHDGRYIAFASSASDLVNGDRNGASDVFVLDRLRGTTERVSVSSTGREGNQGSRDPDISGDGRWIVFSSAASNLVPGDTNGALDVFLHDRRSGSTTLVSRASDGSPADASSSYPSLSPDGDWVSFTSEATTLTSEGGDGNCVPASHADGSDCNDVFLWARRTGKVTLVTASADGSTSDGPSGTSTVSSGGRHVAFYSAASNLDDHDPNPDGWDVFVRDMDHGKTARVTSSDTGDDQMRLDIDMTPDGRWIAFISGAGDLVPNDSNTCPVGYGNAGPESIPCPDAFVYDRTSERLHLISRNTGGQQSDSATFSTAIAADARYVTFGSAAGNLSPAPHAECGEWHNCPDVFVRDRADGRTVLVSGQDAGIR